MTQVKRFVVLWTLLLIGLAGASGASAQSAAMGELVLGREDAPVTMVEYASMTCPHCAKFHGETFKALKEKYIDTGKVRFVYREFPFDRLALAGAIVARCAGEKRAFGMIDLLFAQQSNWAGSQDPIGELANLARLAGLQRPQVDACLEDKALADVVLQNRLTGEKEFKVNSTPSFVINGTLHSGALPIEKFDEILAKHLPQG